MEAYSSTARSSGYTEETLNLSMTAKQPPLYDGKVSWFRYEERWLDNLHNDRTDSLEMFTCTRQSSRTTEKGANYFKNTLKQYFLKGTTNVYLYRLLSFFNHRRQKTEFLIFTSKFDSFS